MMAGSSGVFIKYMQAPATSLGFVRSVVPSLILALWMWRQAIPFFRGNYRLMLLASLLNAARMYFFFTAYIYTSIGNAVIITFSWPIFVSLMSALFLKERILRRNILLLFMAFGGIVLVYAHQPFSFENRDFIGMSAALATALMHAINVVIFKKESTNYSRTEIIFYQNLLGSLVFLPFILLNRPVISLSDTLLASSHAIFLGILGFNLFFFALRHLKASTVSILAYVEIISALLFSTLWFHEPLGWNTWLGGGLIVLATGFLKRG